MYVSPCVQICKIEDGKCIGCGRTSNQITNWMKYTDDERMKIMKELGYGKRKSKNTHGLRHRRKQ